jgi:hypothetical protein
MFAQQPSLSVVLQIVSHPAKDIPCEMLLDGIGGSRQELALEDVKGYYQFKGDPDYATLPFKVDTGAAVTAIKKSDWALPARRRQIRWLHEPGVPPQADGLPGKTYSLGAVGGGTVKVYFGRVCLCFFKAKDPKDPILDVSLVAAFAAEDDALRNTLLGLGGESFKDGGLCLNGKTKTVHLVRI